MMISNMLLRVSIAVVVLLLLIVSTYAIPDCDDDLYHVIIVDGVNGTHNDTMCTNGHLPCATLNMVLKGMKRDRYWYNVCIKIRSGNYTLEYGEENEMSVLYDSSMTIIGSGMNETVINCEPSAGLVFIAFHQIYIYSISFNNCGYNFCHHIASYLQPTAAAIIVSADSNRVTIHNVALYNSNGSGIFINSSSYVTIVNSLITGGTTSYSGINTSSSQVDGGIVVVRVHDYKTMVQISYSNITNNNYLNGAAVTLKTDEHYYENINFIESCFIMNNNRGLRYVSAGYCDPHDCHHAYYDDTIIITNTQLSSLSNTSLIEMPDNVHLQFHFMNVNFTDFIIVNKTIKSINTSFPCYGDVITEVQFCSKHNTCQFPEIDVRFSYMDYHWDAIIGPGICSPNNSCITEYTKGHHCPIQYSATLNNGIYSCWNNHKGPLCGQCIEGHSVAINSPYLACVPCNDTMKVRKGWGLLIVLEFIPVTVMVAVIAVLNVNLNQGSLKAYIFFCQILTIPFPSVSYPSWFVIAYNYDFQLSNIPLVFLAIWNLGFVNYPSCNVNHWDVNRTDVCDTDSLICISRNTTAALGAISFWYLIAFYPFILLLLFYLCVLAYDRGFRYVVCVMRPLHRLLARFWRKFNIQPSLPHTIASVYTLCFTQLTATSLKLLHPTTYDNQLHFFYDGSQRYFSGWHGAAGTLALIVLIVFIIVPVVYLSVYPFMWFQKCLNKVKIRKDLLISVTDVFTAPYNDGTQDTWDYRYYASSHFILQLLVMVLYYIPTPDHSVVILALQICLCSLFLISIVVFRPYKRKVHVFTEAIIILVLMTSSIAILQLYIIDPRLNLLNFNLLTSNSIIVLVLYVIGGLFFLISCCSCCVWFTRKCYKRQRVTRRQQQEVIIADDDDDDPTNDQSEDDALLADRLVNPSYYRSMSLN